MRDEALITAEAERHIVAEVEAAARARLEAAMERRALRVGRRRSMAARPFIVEIDTMRAQARVEDLSARCNALSVQAASLAELLRKAEIWRDLQILWVGLLFGAGAMLGGLGVVGAILAFLDFAAWVLG